MATEVPLSPRTRETLKDLVQPGDILAGKFRVERVLGVGGMGVVVAAMHLQLDQMVALKFLLPGPGKNPDVAARFSREARAAAKIRSEHVGAVIDVGALETGPPYIVMEYLEGSDLCEIVEKHGALPVSLAVDYVLQACEAVAEAHAAGIVHRDLKPSNLFLASQADGTEIVKVLDFGISKAVVPEAAMTAREASFTKTTDVFGSPLYMSPEQLRSARDVDTRTDIWALGAILYELLTGRPPFIAGSLAEIGGMILYQPHAPMAQEGVPPQVEAAVSRCLEKKPANRFPNVAELATALAPFGTHSAQESTTRVARVIRKAGLSLPEIPGTGSQALMLKIVDAADTIRDTSDTDRTQALPAPKGPASAISASAVGQATSHAWGEEKPAAPVSLKVRIAFAASALLFLAVSATAIVVLRGHDAPQTQPGTESTASAEPPHVAAPPPVSAPSVDVGYPVPLPPPIPSATASAAASTPRSVKPGTAPPPRPTSVPVTPKPSAKDGEFGGRK